MLIDDSYTVFGNLTFRIGQFNLPVAGQSPTIDVKIH